MSNASANSSASKKEVKEELPKEFLGFGFFAEEELNKSYSLVIGNTLDFPEPTKELAKSVGNYTIVRDTVGNIIKRVDEEKKVEYVTNKTGKIKARRLRDQQVK